MSQQPLFAGLGIGGHHSSKAKTTTWLTPLPIIEQLGPFDLDPCAYPGWPTAKTLYCLPDSDGLSLPWFGRPWLNPPYGRELPAWLSKMAIHGMGTALIFARTETQAFFDFVWNQAQSLLFIERRLDFYTPAGTKASGNAGAPSVLVAYSDFDTEKLAHAQIRGKLVLLSNQFYCVAQFPMTWRELVQSCFDADRPMQLQDIYELLKDHPKTENNAHWKPKIRQVLQGSQFQRLRPGLFKLKDSHA